MQTGKTNSFVLFLFSFIFYLSSCQRSTAPVYTPQKLQLTVVDVSCTEAWLRLKTEGTEKAENENDRVLQVFRDDSLVVNKDWDAGDSLIYLDGLQPATAYAFSAKLLRDNKLLFSSPKVTATTMDTTSHDFTWQTFEFGGQGGSSSFYDVAIIDENDIWAVGEIYTADDKYNAAHWDGEKWELKKIDWDGYVSRLTCVFAFSSNDVWFGVTNLIHWDGNRFEKNINPVLNQFYSKTVNKIWGTSDNDLYIVGNDGLIAHYDGQTWEKINNKSKVRLLDIDGNDTVWICGWYDLQPTVLLKVKQSKVTTLINTDSIIREYSGDKITGGIFSIWLSKNFLHVLTWNSLYRCYKGNITKVKALWPHHDPSQWAYHKVRGNAINDIVTVGNRGKIMHFNGMNWKRYRRIENNNDYLYGVSIKKNLIVAIGERYLNAVQSYGVIYVGRR